MTALLIAWCLPWMIELGSLKLTPYRIVLIVAFVPCLVALVSGKLGRVRLVDICVLLYGVWCMIALTALHGVQPALQTGGVLFLETSGAYLMARRYIRSADDFYALVRMLFLIVVVLLPFALIETLTGHGVLLEALSHVFPTVTEVHMPPRAGFSRAQSIFDHPILMGVCCGSVFSLAHMVLGRGEPMGKRWLRTATVAFTVVLSLSSCPLSGLTVQTLLMGWNWLLRSFAGRWKLLVGLISAAVLAIQLFAHRPLLTILYQDFAFDAESAMFRVLIWNYGTQSVVHNPLFGVGLGRWERPSWMPPSIDMFWLYNAITYGLPACLLMLAAFFLVVLGAAFRRGLDARRGDYRTAYVISMTAIFVEGWMVHYWNGALVLVLILMGSGVWLLEPQPAAEAAAAPDGRSRLRQRGVSRAAPAQVPA